MIFAESLVNIEKNDERIFIAFNDNVEPFVNKSELIDYLNYTYTKQFVQITTITEVTDVLIRHTDVNTAKYRAARLMNDEATARKVNSGELALNEADKIIPGQLKPMGQKIYITTLETFINRLDELWRRK